MNQIVHPLPPTTYSHQSSSPRRWLERDCHVLTLVLHAFTGWPIITLHDGRICVGRDLLDEDGMLVHSGIRHPTGHFVDAEGLHSRAGMLRVADRYIHMPEMWARWRQEFDAADIRSGLPGSQAVLAAAAQDAWHYAASVLARLLPVPSPSSCIPLQIGSNHLSAASA